MASRIEVTLLRAEPSHTNTKKFKILLSLLCAAQSETQMGDWNTKEESKSVTDVWIDCGKLSLCTLGDWGLGFIHLIFPAEIYVSKSDLFCSI